MLRGLQDTATEGTIIHSDSFYSENWNAYCWAKTVKQ